MNTQITNDDLCKFLESRIQLVRNENYTPEEFLHILAFYIEHQTGSENAFEQEFRRYALMGWYISQNLKENTS